MLNNDYIERRSFAAKVEGMMKRDVEDSAANQPAASFDFDSFIDQFESTQTAAPASLNTEAVVAPAIPVYLKNAEEKAALTGKFHPDELFGNDIAEVDKIAVLSCLAPVCNIDSVTEIFWFLQQQRRTEILQQLLSTGVLKEKARAKFADHDCFGKMLRAVILDGAGINLNMLKLQEMLALISVLETIEAIDIEKPSASEVRLLIPNPFLTDFEMLTDGFIGREEPLNKLFEFLRTDVKNSTASARFLKWNGLWDGLVLTGLGGVGKSTLLAKFVSEVLFNKEASAVLLDFDRPGIDPNDTAWLEIEISRQIGEQHRYLKERLRIARTETYAQKKSYAQESYQESVRYTKSVINEVKDLLLSELNLTTFLLILDTVEEVTQRNLVSLLQYWIDSLADTLHPIKLKVIFSGRLYENQLKEIVDIKEVVWNPLTIDAFDKEIAKKFLQQQKLTDEIIDKILSYETVPLRPLELKLIAQLMLSGSVTIEDLQKDLDEGASGGAIDELFMGLIYRRVLQRIDQSIVSEIASPGLVLRYITPDLVKNVLQPALALEEIDEATAKSLLEKLSLHTWLTYKEGDQVWHRKDLRRSMLRVMIAKEPGKVKAIRETAIAYFNQFDDPESKAESIYHRLMRVKTREDAAAFSLSELGNAYSYISQDIPDLPKPAAVLLKFAANEKIDALDLVLLPDEVFKKAYESVGRSLVQSRQFLKAYEVFQRGKELEIRLTAMGEGLIDKWEKELLYATASWTALKQLHTYQSTNEKTRPLNNLVNYLFPAALLEPEFINMGVMEELLEGAAYKETLFSRSTQGPEIISVLQRLSYGLANLHVRSRLSRKNRSDIRDILSWVKDRDRTLHEKSFFILNQIAEGTYPEKFYLSLPMLRLDAEWIKRLETYTDATFHQVIRDTVNLFTDAQIGQYTATNMLTKIDADREKRGLWYNIVIDLWNLDQKTVFDLIRGPDSLFRDPCRYALLQAIETKADVQQLAHLMQSIIPFKLSDLEPEVFASKLDTNREHALEPFIEIIDRSWKMGELLRSAQKLFPASFKLLEVKNVYTRWETNLETIFLDGDHKKN